MLFKKRSTEQEPSLLENRELSGFARFRKEWIEPILIALLLAGLIRTFIFQPFKIPSGSMEDTLLVGDQLMATKFLYGIKIPFVDKRVMKIRDPRPGDIIVFKYPKPPHKDFIKRCIATGGQKVEIKDKVVFVDGLPQNLPSYVKFVDNHVFPGSPTMPRDNLPEIIVPDGYFFMMGDNRDNSNDSRFWGFVPHENIIGKAQFLYWSWDKNGSFLDKVRWDRILSIIR